MADGITAAPVAPATTTTADAAPSAAAKAADPSAVIPPKADDWKTTVNEQISKAGLKLKAKGREVAVTSIDDLMSRAQRVYGTEELYNDAKQTRAQAEEVLQLRKDLESDDVETRINALQKLSPKARETAYAIAQRDYQRQQEEQALSENERALKRQNEDLLQRQRAYENEKQTAAQKQAQAQHEAEVGRQREVVGGVALKILKTMGLPEASSSSVIPLIARHMRIALEAGAPLDGVGDAVREELQGQWGGIVGQMQPDQLADFLGPEKLAALSRVFLNRRQKGGIAPANGSQPQTQQTKPAGWGTSRYFK